MLKGWLTTKKTAFSLLLVILVSLGYGRAFAVVPAANIPSAKPVEKSFSSPTSVSSHAKETGGQVSDTSPNSQSAHDESAHDESAHDEHGPGMPQMNVKTFPSQIFWLFVTFAFLWFCISKYTFPRLQQTLEDRQKKIDDELRSAEKLQIEAEKIKREFEDALEQARQQAQQHIQNNQSMLQHEIDEKISKSSHDWQLKLSAMEDQVTKWKDKTLESVSEIVEVLCHEILTKFSEDKISHDKLKRDELKKIIEATIHHEEKSQRL